MKLKTSHVVCLIAISFFIAGCAGKTKPELDPEKAKAQAEKTAYFNELSLACAGEKVKLSPGPIRDHKDKLLDRHEFFMSSEGYKDEKKIFDRCSSIEAMDRFFEVFWALRDPDKSTPQNEYKEIIDKRIEDVEQEVLLRDMDIPGTSFSRNRGLKGDLAKVYLLRGAPAPNYKLKIQNMSRLADLMVWVYFDASQRPLFVFLFYDKGDGYKVFQRHMTMNTQQEFMDVLREISRFYPTSPDEYEELYRELMQNDPEYIFRFALQRFSYYEDIKIGKVLSPPTPEAITAKAIQPKILGVPDLPEGSKFIVSDYFASIPGIFRLGQGLDRSYNPLLVLRLADIDWEDKSDIYAASLDLMITITNQKTREKKEFISGLGVTFPAARFEVNKNQHYPVNLGKIMNRAADSPKVTLNELLQSLSPGDYEIKVKLLHGQTLKPGQWFEYLTVPQ